MLEQETVRLPYEEYRAIGELFRAHLKAHEKQIRAVVAFGPLVTRGDTYDIDLLEVVDDWQGLPSVTFSSTAALPLRGLLRLNVLSTQDFEKSGQARNPNMKRFSKKILGQLQQGYEIIYENPFGLVRRVLTQASAATTNANPLTFLDSVAAKETI